LGQSATTRVVVTGALRLLLILDDKWGRGAPGRVFNFRHKHFTSRNSNPFAYYSYMGAIIRSASPSARLLEGGEIAARLSRHNGPRSKLHLVPAKPSSLLSSFFTPWKASRWRQHTSAQLWRFCNKHFGSARLCATSPAWSLW